MHTYLINLARDADRLAPMARQLDALGLPWQRVEAVYGRDLDAEQRRVLYDAGANQRLYHQPLVDGEIGCYTSHLRVWQRLLDDGHPMALVLEDDVDLLPGLPAVLQALQQPEHRRAQGAPNWDMVKLIGRAQEAAAARWPLGAAAPGQALIRYRRVPSLTGAYVVSARGAQRLLAHRQPFFRPIDVDLRCWWEADLRLYGVQPYPVVHGQASFQSSIGQKARQPLARRWRKWLQQLAYSVANARAHRLLATDPGPWG